MYLTRIFSKNFSCLSSADTLENLSTRLLLELETSNGDYSFFEAKYPESGGNNSENYKIIAYLLASNSEKWYGNLTFLFLKENDIRSIKAIIPDEKRGPLGVQHYNLRKVTVSELIKLISLFLANKDNNYHFSLISIKQYLARITDNEWAELFENVKPDLKTKNVEYIVNKFFKEGDAPKGLLNVFDACNSGGASI